jgi:hypothetical protein
LPVIHGSETGTLAVGLVSFRFSSELEKMTALSEKFSLVETSKS